jgi:5-methyltetrahydrofolate--homocysteine methyltransferase
MAEESKAISDIVDSFKSGKFDQIAALVQKSLEGNIDPEDILNKGMIPGIRAVGEQFRSGESYLPDMILSADAFQEGMDILKPVMAQSGAEREITGTIVIGTVKGDIHELGKNIVINVLKTEGFNVIDIGIDVPASKFVDEAEKNNADIIALSALMTTTIPQQREVIEHLEARGSRKQYYVMVGGGATDKNWADKIDADAYGETAVDAVSLALAYMEKSKGGGA